MKRCPDCGRDYNDDSLSFCLDDGAELLFGPATDEPATAIMPSEQVSNEQATQTFDQISRAHPITETGLAPVLPAKNSIIAAMIGIIVISALGIGSYLYYARGPGKQFDSIAVMPFANETGNSDMDYLSDGMTESLIRALSQLPEISVKARSSVFRYKGKDSDAKSVAKELGVQAVLNGSVSQRGDRIILNLELINGENENVIWADQYDRNASELVALQNDIARDVSRTLRSKLTAADQQKIANNYTTNPEAYRLYLQGRFYWNKREENDFRRSIEYFDQAVAIDPKYALAHAGLADAYALLATFGYMPPREGSPKALQYARQAMALDPTLAEPHTTIAYLSQTYSYDLEAAEVEFKRAIELNPSYATAHQWYAEMLTCSGRFDEALAEFHRALELEPLSLPINWDLSRFYYMSRRYDESLAQHRKTIELDPGFARAHRTFSELYKVKGDYANAIEERARYFDLISQPKEAALIRSTFAKGGWPGFLRLLTGSRSVLTDSNNGWVAAKAYIDLGDKDNAFAELNKLYEIHGSSLGWLKVEPQLDPLRGDPRFDELLRKTGFTK